jgi:hypothetical protein
VRAGPTGEEVHHLENDVLVVLATASSDIRPKVLELSKEPLARDSGLELARERAAEPLERLLGRKGRVELRRLVSVLKRSGRQTALLFKRSSTDARAAGRASAAAAD